MQDDALISQLSNRLHSHLVTPVFKKIWYLLYLGAQTLLTSGLLQVQFTNCQKQFINQPDSYFEKRADTGLRIWWISFLWRKYEQCHPSIENASTSQISYWNIKLSFKVSLGSCECLSSIFIEPWWVYYQLQGFI